MKRLVLAALLLAAPRAHAGDVDLSAQAVMLDGGKPWLEVKTRRAVTSGAFVLKRSDGTEVRMEVGALKKGASRRVHLEQPRGKFHWEGTLELLFSGEEFPVSLPVSLDTVVGRPVALAARDADLDLAGKRITVTMNGQARAIRHTVYGDDGKVMDRGETTFENAAEGAPLVVTWKNPRGLKVLRMDLVGEDTAGVVTPTFQLVPWSLDIPHEDVLFPSGQHAVPSTEMEKLRAVVTEIESTAARYGNVVDVSLYVSGYTDTVGSMASNQQLSEQRAQSISRALRGLGVRTAIFYGGYGEWKQATRTGDNVEQRENRRAVYTLSAEPPRPAPAGGWRPL